MIIIFWFYAFLESQRRDQTNGWLDDRLELKQIKIKQESRRSSSTVTIQSAPGCERLFAQKWNWKPAITVTPRGIFLLLK